MFPFVKLLILTNCQQCKIDHLAANGKGGDCQSKRGCRICVCEGKKEYVSYHKIFTSNCKLTKHEAYW